MEIGLGQMGMTPDVFWSYTFREFWAAYYGKFGRAEKPITRADLKKMEQQLLEKSKAKDGRQRNSKPSRQT